ncbi:MAG: PilZ domain-containing protein [Pseudomonadota bacterium]
MAEFQDSADSGLAYTDNISIVWREVDREPDPQHLAMVNASNEGFLRDLKLLGDGGQPRELTEASADFSQELHRLDLKLNLVLDLVSTLIYRDADLPEPGPVRVAADGLSWRGDVPAPGTLVYVELYIQRGLPKPLCCYGEVVSTAAEYEDGLARLSFLGLTGGARAWLEKLIFRHHRREVASRRGKQRSPREDGLD